MGYYIESFDGRPHGKALAIIRDYEAIRVTLDEAKEAIKDPAKGVIVVVRNGAFEAAAFAYDQREFDAFIDLDDSRTKEFLVLPRKVAESLSGFDPAKHP